MLTSLLQLSKEKDDKPHLHVAHSQFELKEQIYLCDFQLALYCLGRTQGEDCLDAQVTNVECQGLHTLLLKQGRGGFKGLFGLPSPDPALLSSSESKEVL